MKMTEEEMKKIVELVSDNMLFCTKEVLTITEVMRYTGLSRNQLYKLMHKYQLPYYKPMGICYFNRKELEQWMQRNPRGRGNGSISK